MFGLGGPELLTLVALGVFVVLPLWKIFAKAGFSGSLALTQVIPILNLIVLFYVAFSEWPIHRQLKQVEQGRPQAT